MPSTTINLADEGLTDGDHISSYIDEHWQDGVELLIPPGSYGYDGTGLSGTRSDCSLIGSEEGVEFHRPGDPEETVRPFIKAAAGTVRVENITVRGRKGQEQSRWRFDATGGSARCEIVNVNHPDGSVDTSDSLAFYVGKYHRGTALFKNCYIGPHGNSAIYANVGSEGAGADAPVIVENCVFLDPNNVIRVGHNNSVYRDCTVVWRGTPNAWKNGSWYARGLRADDPHEGDGILIENMHFYFGGSVANNMGGAIEIEGDGAFSGTIRGIYVHTEGDGGGITGDLAGFQVSNINGTGPGAPIPIDKSGVTQGSTPPDLRNEGVIWMPESETVRPAGGSSPSPEPEPTGDLFTIMSTGAGDVFYEFTVIGTVTPATDPNFEGASAGGEANVTITDNADDTMTVTGKTGGGFGDAFRVDGQVESFQQTGGDGGYELYLNGEPRTNGAPDGDGGTHTFEVIVDGEAHTFEVEDPEGVFEGESSTVTVTSGEGTPIEEAIDQRLIDHGLIRDPDAPAPPYPPSEADNQCNGLTDDGDACTLSYNWGRDEPVEKNPGRCRWHQDQPVE